MFATNGLQQNVTLFCIYSNFPLKLPILKINRNVAMAQVVLVDGLWRQRSWFDPMSAHVQLLGSQGGNWTRVSPSTSVFSQCSILTYLSPTLLQFRKWVQRYVTTKKQLYYRPVSEDDIIVMLCQFIVTFWPYTGLSKKMDGIWNPLPSTCTWLTTGVNIAPASQGHPLAVPVSTTSASGV